MDKETKQMFKLILQKLDSMEKRQDEIFTVVKAIEHSNNVRTVKVDNLTYKAAHVEGTLNDVGELIEKRKAIK